MMCAPSEDSDQPGHEESLVPLLPTERPAKTLIRLGGCIADAQADLSLRWAHGHFVGFDMSRLIFETLYVRET